jgi:hypothetical protein
MTMLQRLGLVALMMVPMVALGQSKVVAGVCTDHQRKTSCITAQSALPLVLPGARQTKSEALLSERKSARLVYLQPLFMTGSEQLALGITEVVEKDAPSDARPDCRNCVPNMILSVFEPTKGVWRLAAQSKELPGLGSWGQLHTRLKTVDLGRRQLLIAIETGYTGQGITETAVAYHFAYLEPVGRLGRSVIDIGSIATGVDACGGLDQDATVSQTDVLVLRRRDLMPDFLTVQTQTPCDGSKAAESAAPVLYRVNSRTLKIEQAR